MIQAPDLRNLAELPDSELLALIRSKPAASELRESANGQLVKRYRSLVGSCVQQFHPVAGNTEDLMQVGYLGLVKAINNFDPAFGVSLVAYAKPCISGEIKRYFRDARWQLHVARPVKELAAEVRRATPQLSQDLGRTPAEPDLAKYLSVSTVALRNARLAEMAFHPASLEAPTGAGTVTVADRLGTEDPRIEHVLGMLSVAAHWSELPAREQKILILRFYQGMTQVQIGQQFGISQMQVSRLIAHALGYLRSRVFGMQEWDHQVAAGPGGGSARPPGNRTAHEKLRDQAPVPA
jgi:RNA polymerase sigma-B factor